ncbi:hypothetical protein [Halorubrum distributum]|uniref:Uncharacterized protein n=1 Tax=Halorubrum distributum JCM 13916 TaxID=1230455 RepID=M0PQG6_9EURY|nr:hypothetical protein [Halorubrum arcis]EMA71090.1 hypothetical protein C462_08220 [Halorubrum arcis JCM 13916]
MGDERGTGTQAGSVLRRAARQSRLGQLWRRAATAVRSSYLYRWLTAEPDPEVIVIDLRETWTVGPVIRLLDAILDRLIPALDDSRVAAAARTGAASTLAAPAVVGGLAVLVAGLALVLVSTASGTLGTTRFGVAGALAVAGAIATRERRSWAELRETRPVELLVAALEPPEPPDESEPSAAPTDGKRDPTATDTDELNPNPPGQEADTDGQPPDER